MLGWLEAYWHALHPLTVSSVCIGLVMPATFVLVVIDTMFQDRGR